MEETKNIISTKANTLYALRALITRSRIEEMFILYVGDYQKDKGLICRQIKTQFKGCRIVVRSSSSNEDCFTRSNAGHYKSILDVDSSDIEEIEYSVDEVIRSYGKDIEFMSREQVLIQRQAEEVCISGVVFTRDLQGNRPYYLVNYDGNGSTDSVTSGCGGATLWVSRDVVVEALPQPWKNLLLAVQEVEQVLEGTTLDIEFAIDSQNVVTLFQIRPLAASYHQERLMDDAMFINRKEVLKRLYCSKKSSITGEPMMLSDMAFWNPSEIIGSAPRPLDYSLYREIITTSAWNTGLLQLGYRKVPEELMIQIGNKPYISLDYSFYSLIPASISEELARKLTYYYMEELKKNLTAHDKIEFEIVFSCYDFSTQKRLDKLLAAGFTKEERDEIAAALKKMTVEAVQYHKETLEDDVASLSDLNQVKEWAEMILKRQDGGIPDLIRQICRLLDSLKILGTPQFTRQARQAFMARAFCTSLTENGWFTDKEMDDFMRSISTVSSDFEQDFQDYSSGKLSRESFDKKYGHLRSGTYDIRSDRYDEINFRPMSERRMTAVKINKSYQLDEKRIEQALKAEGLDLDAGLFIEFLKTSIEQREYFKFEFTKSLSLVLQLIRAFGERLEIKREDLSFLKVKDFRTCPEYTSYLSLRLDMERKINRRKEEYALNRAFILPEVVLDGGSLDFIPVYEARPNFITSKRTEGEVVLLEEDPNADITDKIVVVTKADPGFEWIFAKGIKGFITKYGGAASHMAIRCAEFDIPAAIGCGEKIYEYVKTLSYLDLNCATGEIQEGIQYINLHALITQREGVNQYGDPTDILESAYIRFYELLGFIPKPVSNHTKNFERLFDDKVDLLIVVGGGSLPVECYDREHHDELQPHRDATERKLIFYCVEHGIPIIATCRGMQYINVLFGGKLRYHPELPVERPRGRDHKVWLTKENREISINNYHADVIFKDDLAPCFEPVAIDPENNVIEAYTSEEKKILALQWHPERKFDTPEGLEETRKIVGAFIQKYIK